MYTVEWEITSVALPRAITDHALSIHTYCDLLLKINVNVKVDNIPNAYQLLIISC